MKLVLVVLGCAAVFVISGCADTAHQSRSDSSGSVGTNGSASKLETISYDWEEYGIKVSFFKRDGEPTWGVTIRDSWDVYEQSKDGSKVWGLSASKCSQKECLRLIDRSLTEFHTEKPDARFHYVAIEMQLVRDLWGEVLAGLNRRLSSLDGTKAMGLFDVPPEIEDEVTQVLNTSHTVGTIRDLLQKYGMNVQGVYLGEQVMFKDALSGRKWFEIANLPGIGVLDPGVVEFDLSKSPTGSALENKTKVRVPLQSASW